MSDIILYGILHIHNLNIFNIVNMNTLLRFVNLTGNIFGKCVKYQHVNVNSMILGVYQLYFLNTDVNYLKTIILATS